MRRRVCWVVGLVVGVYAGVASAETLESVTAKISEQVAKYKSIQMKQKSASETIMPEMRIKTDLEIEAGYERRPEEKYVSRIEAKSVVLTRPKDQPETKTDSNILTICDAKFVYMLSRTAEMTSAMKMKLDTQAAMNPFSVKAVFEIMRKEFELKLLPDDKLDGKDCYVIEAVPKSAEVRAVMSRTVTWYDKKTAIGMKSLGYDKDGKVTSTMTVTSCKFDEDIPDDKFVFKPPAGVEVTDMTQTPGPEAGTAGASPTTRDASSAERSESKTDKPAQSDASKTASSSDSKQEPKKDDQKKDTAGKAVKGLLKGLGR